MLMRWRQREFWHAYEKDLDIFYFSLGTNQTNETIHYPGDTLDVCAVRCSSWELVGHQLGGFTLSVPEARAGIVVVCHPSLNPGIGRKEGRCAFLSSLREPPSFNAANLMFRSGWCFDIIWQKPGNAHSALTLGTLLTPTNLFSQQP